MPQAGAPRVGVASYQPRAHGGHRVLHRVVREHFETFRPRLEPRALPRSARRPRPRRPRLLSPPSPPRRVRRAKRRCDGDPARRGGLPPSDEDVARLLASRITLSSSVAVKDAGARRVPRYRAIRPDHVLSARRPSVTTQPPEPVESRTARDRPDSLYLRR